MGSATQAEIDAMLGQAASIVEESCTPVHSSRRSRRGAAGTGGRSDKLRSLLELEVPVIVKLAESTMPLAEVMGLAVGAILEFDISHTSELSLMINNKCIGFGTAVKVGENFGLRVTRMAPADQRIKALQ